MHALFQSNDYSLVENICRIPTLVQAGFFAVSPGGRIGH